MKKYIAIALVLIILTVIIQVANGENTIISDEDGIIIGVFRIEIPTDPIDGQESIPYFKEHYFMDRSQPVACVHESKSSGFEQEVYENIAKNAIASWVDKLTEKTNGTSEWYIHYTFVPEASGDLVKYTSDYKYCDINILFDNSTPLNIETGGYIKGGTWHYTSVNHWADIKIYTWDYKPIESTFDDDRNVWIKNYQAVQTPVEVAQQTLEHELGHVFGLKHHEIDGNYYVNNGSYDKEHALKSMMYFATNSNHHGEKQLQDIDINAVIHKYYKDGWGGKFNNDATEYIKE